MNAGIECMLVGGATHPGAIGSFENLLELVRANYPRSQQEMCDSCGLVLERLWNNDRTTTVSG